MDPDIELQIRVDVLGLENLRRLGSVVNGLKRNLDAVSESANEQRSRWAPGVSGLFLRVFASGS